VRPPSQSVFYNRFAIRLHVLVLPLLDGVWSGEITENRQAQHRQDEQNHEAANETESRSLDLTTERRRLPRTAVGGYDTADDRSRIVSESPRQQCQPGDACPATDQGTPYLILDG
jgi:hypothetical protein